MPAQRYGDSDVPDVIIPVFFKACIKGILPEVFIRISENIRRLRFFQVDGKNTVIQWNIYTINGLPSINRQWNDAL
jgi:hypothetical protein